MEFVVTKELRLVSHKLCPYVQRAVIAMKERGLLFQRLDVDLANKPDWFKAISPLGKTPVLLVGERAIFESSVILEYLEEAFPGPLHPSGALQRAEHRSWIEFASSILADIWGFYVAPDADSFEAKRRQLKAKFAWLEKRVLADPWFEGEGFSLVDAAFGPVFRYFDVFDKIGDFAILEDCRRLACWRANLSARPSVLEAVGADYNELLWDFLHRRGSHLTSLMVGRSPNEGTRMVA